MLRILNESIVKKSPTKDDVELARFLMRQKGSED